MTQEPESTWSHLWLRAQDCWIFLRHSFLSQSAPVSSLWTGDFVRHHPLTKASVQPADCQHYCLLPRHPAHTTLAHQLAFPEKLNCKQMQKQNLLWFPWGWVHRVTRDGGNCTAALMFPGEPISGLWAVSWAPLWRKTTRSLRSHWASPFSKSHFQSAIKLLRDCNHNHNEGLLFVGLLQILTFVWLRNNVPSRDICVSLAHTSNFSSVSQIGSYFNGILL